VFMSERPNGRVALATHSTAISKEKDPLTKTKLLEQLLAAFPMKEEDLLVYRRQLLMGFVQTKQYEKGYTLLKSSPKIDPALYRTLTSDMIETGVQVDKAVEWLADGVDIARKLQKDAKSPSLTNAEWKKNYTNALAGLLTMRGVGLVNLGRNIEAEPVLLEAHRMKNGEDLVANENLINAYATNGKFKEAEKLGLDCIRKSKSNLKIVEKLKIAYKNEHGSLGGYDKTVKDARSEEEMELLKSGINKPAPDFSLKDTSGTIVKLSDLRGRVVVLDFWTTWSVQCKVSLAQFQKVFERYESYKTVTLVSLNTSENITGPEREAAVKKFMAHSKLTFPVVYDNGLETARKFGIEGIPTTVVIDRNGNIQFVSSGSKDGNEVVNDLINQIEVLLKH
jgi:peroxiredoxin